MGGVIHMKEKMIVFVKKETVLVVAAILAVMSAFFVHPDQAYIDYIDFRVLGILLSLMIIMAGVQNNGIFDEIGRRLLAHTKNTAQLAFVLDCCTCLVQCLQLQADGGKAFGISE